MHNPICMISCTASGAIAKRRIVALADGKQVAVQAKNTTKRLFGISDPGKDVTDGSRADIITHGFADVVYGGTISEGAPVTADADGKAVIATPAASAQAPIIGFAVEDGTDGVIGSVRLAPGIITGV